MRTLPSIFLFFAVILFSCKAKKEVAVNDTSMPLTNDEVVSGLKEALQIATVNSTAAASEKDAYLKDPSLRIPFPPQAEKMKEKLSKLGFRNKIDEFEASLNKAGEEVAKGAGPVFKEAIEGMSITDAMTILNGSDTAATHYLREKTYATLIEKLNPVVKDAIGKAKVTAYWDPLVTTYNKIPFVENLNPDLENYVTHMAVQGLFKLIAKEEIKIRKNPAARVTTKLVRVFGNRAT